MVEDAATSAKQAITIAPLLARGHTALAKTLNYQLRFKSGFDELQKATRLSRNDPWTLAYGAIFLVELGRTDQAWQLATALTALDPLSGAAYEIQTSVLYHSHQFAKAITAARRSL